MGPKKKKAEKKGGGNNNDAALDKLLKPPPTFQVSRQLDQEKIDALSGRVEQLLLSNNSLRTSSTRNEKDTHDIVLYFQRELEVKDELIGKLNEELAKRETQLKFEVDRLTGKFEKEYHTLRKTSGTQIDELTQSLAEAERELKLVEQYRREKDSHMQMIDSLKKELDEQSRESVEQLDLLERKFLEDKAHILREAEDEKKAFREVAIKEAKEMLGGEVHKLMADNDRMHEELKFHHQMAVELQKDKDGQEKNLTRCNRELVILNEKEEEYARQGLLKTKEIKALRERVEQLEKQQIVNIERFRHRTKELKQTVHKELEDATLDAAGLRRLIKIKNKELRHMKSLAATILSQRSEVEQFFLESLDEVKQNIRKERKKQRQIELAMTARQNAQRGKQSKPLKGTGPGKGGSFRGPTTSGLPQINVSKKQQHLLEARGTSNLPTGEEEEEKVTLKDLEWSDKELVLRVLFAKMNGLQDSVNQAVQDSRARGVPGNEPPQHVFVSEGQGVGMDEAEMEGFQDMFMVDDGGAGNGDGDADELGMDEGKYSGILEELGLDEQSQGERSRHSGLSLTDTGM